MSIYDIPVRALDGGEASLRDYEGKVLLIVNVASKCGLTPQYTGLETLHEKLADRGFAVLGFPCNQFGEQEPGSAEEIATFLSEANPYLSKDAVQGLLLAHGGHHIQQIQQLKDRKYEAEARTWEEMKKHVYQIADATAAALAKQFASKFS